MQNNIIKSIPLLNKFTWKNLVSQQTQTRLRDVHRINKPRYIPKKVLFGGPHL